jgi:hypothetical protein
LLTRKYQLLLIVVIVLASFYPSYFAGFAPVDDEAMEVSYRGIEKLDLGGHFVPAHGDGLYYRPLINLSLRIDKLLFGFDPGIMHLENVLFHVINAILVYLITRQLVPLPERFGSLLPLFVSLVFALHPVNAESVNWISGRSDLLAGSFLFTSMLFLLLYREGLQKKYGILSFASFLMGALTKETSLAFLPGALLVLTAYERPVARDAYSNEIHPQNTYQHWILIVSGAVLALGVFTFLRSAAFTSSSSRIGLTLMAMKDDWVHSAFIVMRAFGFYLKKLVYPFPLNFAIIEVDPLYEVLAVPLLLACIFVVTRRTVLSALFATGIVLITPSFLLAFGQIAWTPYAERYIYLTSAFVIPAAIVWAARTFPVGTMPVAKVGMTVVILVLFGVMFHRSFVWQDNMRLIADTVEKTPGNKSLRNIYAMQLARKGEYAAAREQLNNARELYERVYDPRAEFITAYIHYREGHIEESQRILEKVVEKTRGTSIEALEYLVSLLEEKRRTGVSRSELRTLERSLFRHTLRLYALTGDPHLLYDLGAIVERQGDRGRALRLYRQASNNLPEGDQQRLSALRKIDILTSAKGAPRGE